jgi:hypothetical protein
MPAKSKSQQRFMGMVHAYQKGELNTSDMDKDLLSKIKSTAKSMSKGEAKKYAETKHKGLPEEVKENIKNLSFKQFLVEVS